MGYEGRGNVGVIVLAAVVFLVTVAVVVVLSMWGTAELSGWLLSQLLS